MRTNIDLDEAIVAEAQRLGGLRTKREAVDVALRDFVARRRQQELLALDGRTLLAGDYDVRAVRKRMGQG